MPTLLVGPLHGELAWHQCAASVPEPAACGATDGFRSFSSSQPGQRCPDSSLAWSLKSGDGGERRTGGQGARIEEASQGTEEAAAWVEEKTASGMSSSALALRDLSRGLLTSTLVCKRNLLSQGWVEE